MEWIVAALLVIGGTFMLLAAVGIVRMPDLYTRLQAISKASTLGIGGVLLAAALGADAAAERARAILGIAFFFLTIPVSTHVIARAAYRAGVRPWEGSRIDELRGEPLRPEPTGPIEDVAERVDERT